MSELISKVNRLNRSVGFELPGSTELEIAKREINLPGRREKTDNFCGEKKEETRIFINQQMIKLKGPSYDYFNTL